jgi:ABC-type nitrate/sulfonate/bicarbonate transport system substrate-binding protein
MDWQAIWTRLLAGMAAALLCGLTAGFPGALQAADTVMVGSVDPSSANLWPLYIGQKLGYFEAAALKIDLIFAPSNAAVIQQLAAGSYDVAPSAGMVDPVRAIEKGAPEAIVRIVIQAPPYALLAKSAIKTMGQLKGKTLMLGGAKDITRIFAERMLVPNGVKPGDYDMLFAGATSARFAALQSGAVDAALLTVPFNFYAETAGFSNLGFTFDYLPDMPFAGMAVNRNWATANRSRVERFLDVYNKAIAWFADRRNREEAVRMMVETSKLNAADVARAYDFLHDKDLFEPTGKVSKSRLGTIVQALRELGDIAADFPVERLLLPGVTQVTD